MICTTLPQIVCSFGGLLHALLRYQGADPHAVLADDKHARRVVSVATFGWSAGPTQTAEAALFWIRLMVFQFAIVAPLCGLMQAVLMYMGNDSEMSQMLFSVARAVSMVVALKVGRGLFDRWGEAVSSG